MHAGSGNAGGDLHDQPTRGEHEFGKTVACLPDRCQRWTTKKPGRSAIRLRVAAAGTGCGDCHVCGKRSARADQHPAASHLRAVEDPAEYGSWIHLVAWAHAQQQPSERRPGYRSETRTSGALAEPVAV